MWPCVFSLSRTFLLIDSSCGINDVDKIGVGMLEEFGRPYTVRGKFIKDIFIFFTASGGMSVIEVMI